MAGLLLGCCALLLTSSPLRASDPLPRDPVADALSAELRRAMGGLRLEGQSPPYFIAYDLEERDTVEVETSLGALVGRRRSTTRTLGVEVRVGDPKQDNTNFQMDWNRRDGIDANEMVLGEDPVAIARSAWLLTDDCYKDALINLGRKEAVRKGQRRNNPPPDFAPGAPSTGSLPAAPLPDEAPLVARMRELSRPFRAHPDIVQSRVTLSWTAGRRLLLDSGGTLVSKPTAELELRVIATIRAPDGAAMTDHATWFVSTAADLPSQEVLLGETDALIARLHAWRTAHNQTEEYLGPVLFEGEAAVDLWARLLASEVSGTPPEEEANPYGGSPSGDGGLSLRRRLLPSGWSAWDDPQAEPTSPAAYTWDDEGQPAARVDLIREGVVVGLLGSRTPGRSQRESNGHARGRPGELKRGLPSYFVVEPPRALSPRKLYASAANAGTEVGLDGVLVIRRLEDASATTDASFRSLLLSLNEASILPPPIEMVLRDANGQETPVRGLRFTEVDLRSLRGVLAAGSSVQGVRKLQSNGFVGGPMAILGHPVALSVPAVLLDELRLAPDTSEVVPLPPVPSPLR
jgi:hypothetical protein